MKNEWTLFVITDTGRRVPHWSAGSRQQCRDQRKLMTIPKGVRTKIEKTRPKDYHWDQVHQNWV